MEQMEPEGERAVRASFRIRLLSTLLTSGDSVMLEKAKQVERPHALNFAFGLVAFRAT